MRKEIKLVLVDDNTLYRQALKGIFNQTSHNIIVTFEASDGQELIDKIKLLSPVDHPDVILTDVNMPNINGFQIVEWLKKNHPGILVIAFTLKNDDRSIIRLIKGGIHGYLHKTAEPPEILMALQTVVKGANYFPAHLSLEGVQQLEKNEFNKVWNSLSKRDKDLVIYCSKDLALKEIAAALNMAPQTVEKVTASLYSKFGVHTRVGLVMLAVKNHII